MLADRLSRARLSTWGWSLDQVVADCLFRLRGSPLVDLFALDSNNEAELFVPPLPREGALVVDALSMPWHSFLGYAVPPGVTPA